MELFLHEVNSKEVLQRVSASGSNLYRLTIISLMIEADQSGTYRKNYFGFSVRRWK